MGPGGSATQRTLLPVWGLLADSGGGGGDHAASLLAAVQRALKIRLLKHVSSSGMLSANGASARRRSSAANSEGSLLFHHLRVLDCMREAMLAERAAEVHRACVEALEGLVEDNAMAQHSEGAGAFLRAAQLHRKDARRLSAQRETAAAVPATRHALRCLDRCDGDGDAHARDTLEIDCVGFMISPAGGLVELAGVESILGRVQRLEQTEAWRETPEYVRLALKATLQLTRVFVSLDFDSHTAHNSVGRMSEEIRSTFFGMAASALATASPTLESTTGQELDVRHHSTRPRADSLLRRIVPHLEQIEPNTAVYVVRTTRANATAAHERRSRSRIESPASYRMV